MMHQGPGRRRTSSSATASREDGHRGRDVRLPARQSALRRGVEEGRAGRSATSTRSSGFAGRFGAGLPRINDGSLPVPPAHDLEDEAARGGRRRGSPSSSTARRCSRATPARARARSAAGSSRTTGSRPSSPCPTSSSTTPASRTYIWIVTNRKPRSAQGQGPAHRRRRPLREDAEEPRQQAQRDQSTEQHRRDHPPLRRLRGGRARRRSSTTRTSATGGSRSSGRCG